MGRKHSAHVCSGVLVSQGGKHVSARFTSEFKGPCFRRVTKEERSLSLTDGRGLPLEPTFPDKLKTFPSPHPTQTPLSSSKELHRSEIL